MPGKNRARSLVELHRAQARWQESNLHLRLRGALPLMYPYPAPPAALRLFGTQFWRARVTILRTGKPQKHLDDFRRGISRQRKGALPLSCRSRSSRQESNLRPPAYQAKYPLSAPPAELCLQSRLRATFSSSSSLATAETRENPLPRKPEIGFLWPSLKSSASFSIDSQLGRFLSQKSVHSCTGKGTTSAGVRLPQITSTSDSR